MGICYTYYLVKGCLRMTSTILPNLYPFLYDHELYKLSSQNSWPLPLWHHLCSTTPLPLSPDRMVYCTNLTTPGNSTKKIVNQPNLQNEIQMETSITYTCPLEYWYFNYSVPDNLTSFYYSRNINTTTLTCNNYGWVQ